MIEEVPHQIEFAGEHVQSLDTIQARVASRAQPVSRTIGTGIGHAHRIGKLGIGITQNGRGSRPERLVGKRAKSRKGGIQRRLVAGQPLEDRIRIVAADRHELHAQIADLAAQYDAAIDVVVDVIETDVIADPKWRVHQRIRGMVVGQYRGLEHLRKGLEFPVAEVVAGTNARTGHAFVGIFLRGEIQEQVATQVEAVGHIEHPEEDRLTPGDLLVAEANP